MTLDELPLITPDLDGTGGQIKVEPDHFVVDEVPLYEPSGQGDHLFVRLTRAGRTTQEVVADLAAELQVPAGDIGYAGLKDKQARATQVFSLPRVRPEEAQRAAGALGWELHWAVPHNKKLHTGHLLGNRFTITVLDPTVPDPMACAGAIVAALLERGLPNYFGAQRFGKWGDNADRGLAVLSGQMRRPGAKWLHELMISAYQSQLFNEYLALRLKRGLFDCILDGELVKKTDTGGMFIVEDVAIDQARFDHRDITYTGPLFGYDMWWPQGAAAELEAEVLATSPVKPEDWRRHRVSGSRRPAKLFLQPIDLLPHPQGFVISFFLPKGAYATILLREVLKAEPELLPEDPLPDGETSALTADR